MQQFIQTHISEYRLGFKSENLSWVVASKKQLQFVGFSAQELSCVCASVFCEVYVIGKLFYPS